MKKLINFCCAILIANVAISQSVLMTNKALTLPTYVNQAAINSAITTPTNGMLVFDINTDNIKKYSAFSTEWHSLLKIPSFNSIGLNGQLFSLRNTNLVNATAIYGETYSGDEGSGVEGVATNNFPTWRTYGIRGINNSLNDFGYGVFGQHDGEGVGVRGKCNDGIGVQGTSNSSYGVYGSSDIHIGVYGISNSNVGGYFSSNEGTSLQTGSGKVGIGIFPNLNVEEIMDVDGRIRIRHGLQTAGFWCNNNLQGITSNDGAFFGLENPVPGSERAGIFIGNSWRFLLTRAGNAIFTGTVCASNITCPSDLRFKKNIKNIQNPIESLFKINGVSYDWRKDEFPEKQFSDKNQIGFIAQDIEKIYPEMVFTDEKGYKSVDYARITPVLVEAIKEQQRKIERLENIASKTENLEKEMQQIRSMLQAKEGNLSKN